MNMTLHHHIALLSKFDRGLALKELISQAVKPGARVLDAGCGTGLLSIFAVQAGAKEVLAVDAADTSVAEALARENNCLKHIKFLQCDLDSLSAKEQGQFDVLIGMIYFNDPRRDEAQSRLAARLAREFLRPGGRCIPDSVEYLAIAMDWPSQNLTARVLDLHNRVALMEGRYGLRFGPLANAGLETPNPQWYPLRDPAGCLIRPDARLLSEPAVFARINHEQGMAAYPTEIKIKTEAPGLCDSILFIQNIRFGERIIFSNESVSWIENPAYCSAGTLLSLECGAAWHHANRLRLLGAD